MEYTCPFFVNSTLSSSSGIGIVETNEKDSMNKSLRRQVEVDFVASLGNRRLYIQSAYSMPDAEKLAQEKRPFKFIGDAFTRVIITREAVKPHFDDDGVYLIPLRTFLLNPGMLDRGDYLCINKGKQPGVREVTVGDRTIVEALV